MEYEGGVVEEGKNDVDVGAGADDVVAPTLAGPDELGGGADM